MASELELEISRVEATVYKSPYCGCCVGWSNVAKKNGFEIATEQMQDRSSIKEKYNIPQQMQSCHTTIVGDYFVEGHVPLEVVKKLLEDKPDINGIALPNMQSGSPGMPGIKRGEFEIYQITDGVYSHYINY